MIDDLQLNCRFACPWTSLSQHKSCHIFKTQGSVLHRHLATSGPFNSWSSWDHSSLCWESPSCRWTSISSASLCHTFCTPLWSAGAPCATNYLCSGSLCTSLSPVKTEDVRLYGRDSPEASWREPCSSSKPACNLLNRHTPRLSSSPSHAYRRLKGTCLALLDSMARSSTQPSCWPFLPDVCGPGPNFRVPPAPGSSHPRNPPHRTTLALLLASLN